MEIDLAQLAKLAQMLLRDLRMASSAGRWVLREEMLSPVPSTASDPQSVPNTDEEKAIEVDG